MASDILVDDLENFLAHYGKKGMKWGVVNEDKPVARAGGTVREGIKDKASVANTKISAFRDGQREKGIARLNARADILNKQIKELELDNKNYEGSKNPAKIYAKYANDAAIKTIGQQRDQKLKDVEAKKEGRLTSTQKKVIIGAAFVGALVVAGAVAQGQESGAINSAVLRGKAFILGKESPFLKNQDLTGKMSVDDILKNVSRQVNPNYKAPGGLMNCRRCTFTQELRRRGFDVAATTASMGTGQSDSGFINAVTPGQKNFIDGLSVSKAIQINEQSVDPLRRISGGALTDSRNNPLPKEFIRGLKTTIGPDGLAPVRESSSLSVLKALEKQPNGARGEVLFNFGSFGHSMHYEIIDGKATIFDSQKAKAYDAIKRVEEKWDGFHTAEITRLDNVDLDANFLTRWATNVKEPTKVKKTPSSGPVPTPTNSTNISDFLDQAMAVVNGTAPAGTAISL